MLDNTKGVDIPFQSVSTDIWGQKYCLRDSDGTPLEKSIEDSFKRTAKALSEVEVGKKQQHYWYRQFLWALRNGAIPAGRILSNAGAIEYKSSTSTINCVVSGTINDSMSDILEKNYEAGLTLKAGCGIGYEFSSLRPKGAYVSGAGAKTSGPLSFMDIFDKTCFTVSSAGGRRGAQMATFDVSHPDVLDFIKAKREDARLRQFNLSLLITEDFVDAVINEKPWNLVFPITVGSEEHKILDLDDPNQVMWRHQALDDDFVKDAAGRVACKIYRTVPAKNIWNSIMTSTYDFAEPGFILIDKVNKMNNNWFCESIRATNPCGEQPLPPYGSCLLGSVNLTKFVDYPFTEQAKFNWDRFDSVVKTFTRMLDNVVEISGLPLDNQRKEIEYKRRHGMGFLGLGSALTMLRIKYGSEEAVKLTEEVAKQLAIVGWRTGVELAEEKGPAPIMEDDFTVTQQMLIDNPDLIGNVEVGNKVKGKYLLSRSRYMRQFLQVDPNLLLMIEEKGCRFTHHSSIAPTGTISLSIANNVSNGIEPSFAHHYFRNVIREGKKSKEKVDVFSFELLAYRHLINEDAYPGSEFEECRLPDYFVTTDDITPQQHVDMQAAAQKWVDSSISKTINVPTDIDYDSFKDIYLYAYQKGLKGCTTFRFNPEAFQGVLVREDDIANTTYKFTLEDGRVLEFKGNEEIVYDGETHTAANLYDALKEGYYGKL